MQPLYHEYMDVQGDFISYEDFNKNFRLKRPASFNFAYDVVDRLGRENPERPALLWTDPEGDVVRYDFRRKMRSRVSGFLSRSSVNTMRNPLFRKACSCR